MDLKQIDLILDNDLLPLLTDSAKDDLMNSLISAKGIKLPEELDGLYVDAIYNLDPRDLDLHRWYLTIEARVDKTKPYIDFLGAIYVN